MTIVGATFDGMESAMRRCRWIVGSCLLAALAAAPATAPTLPAVVEATAPRPAGTLPVRWSAEVRLAAADWPHVQPLLDRPVDLGTTNKLVMVKDHFEKSPRTAADYLQLVDAGYAPKTNYDIAMAGSFEAAASPLRWLSHCKPATVSHVQRFDPAADPRGTLAVLPADLGVDMTGEHAGQRWLAAWPDSKATAVPGHRAIDVDDGGDGRTRIEAVAWGDRDGDGTEDCLLAVANHITDGTFHAYGYVTVTRKVDGGPLTIVKVKP